VDLYSAFIVDLTVKELTSQSHSSTYKLHHTCLYLVSVFQMAPPLIVLADI